jgi:hypothetical protein
VLRLTTPLRRLSQRPKVKSPMIGPTIAIALTGSKMSMTTELPLIPE